MLRSSAILALAGSLFAQNQIIHYTFDSTDTTQVLNYASGPQAAPSFGTTSWPAEYTYAPGRFGSALDASPYLGGIGNFVQTGCTCSHQGAVTISFFLFNVIASDAAGYSPVTGQPGWSIATGGSAGPGLQLVGWGGAPINGNFSTAVFQMSGWNHFAVVVDPQTGTASWYHNGVPATTTPIPGSAGVVFGGGELLVGADYVNMCGSLYRIDEFRMLGRAATTAEIAAWANQPAAATTTFGVAHGITLQANSLPTIGNLGLVLDASAPQSTIVVLTAGSSYAMHGMLPLPLDLGALLPGAGGQLLLVAPVTSAASLVIGGEASFPLPIPELPALGGAQLFLQTIGLGEDGSVQSSGAVALRVGR